MKTLKELRAEAADLSARLAAPGEGDNLAELTIRANEVADEIEARVAEETAANEARSRIAGLPTAVRTPSAAPAAPAAPAAAGMGTDTPPAGDPEGRSIGRQFVDGVVGEARSNGFSGSFAIDVPGDVRSLIDTAGWPVQPTRLPGVTTQTTRDRALKIVDLIDRRPLGTNVIEWIREDSLTSAAAETTEGSAKPESTFVLSQQTSTAATIAHFVNVTRQAADDDSQMTGYVEGRLLYGLNKRLEDQTLSGNGTLPNLRGITATAGIGTFTAGTATEAALISIRKAITTAQISEYFPDAVVLNPIDWEAIELSVDSQGMFRVSPNVQQALTPTIWGLSVVVSNAIVGTVFGTTGGKFLVGAFKEGATLWERDGIRLFMSDSHASNFTSNILVILAEMRAALTVWRPKAFVYGTLGASRT